MAEYDPTGLALGTADMMSSNLTQLGSDILEKRQTEMANELNYAFWKLQNAYNDPSQQMARLRAAGLNPNLMYGKGTMGNSESRPQMQKSNASGKMEFNTLETYMAQKQMELVPYQIDLTKKQIKNQIVQEEINQEKLRKEKFWNKIYDYTDVQNVGAVYLRDVLAPAEKREWEVKNLKETNLSIENQHNIQKLQAQLLTGQIDLQNYEKGLNDMGLTKSDKTVYRLFEQLIRNGIFNE